MPTQTTLDPATPVGCDAPTGQGRDRSRQRRPRPRTAPGAVRARARHDDRGAVTSLVILAPLMVLLVLLPVQFAMVWHANNVVEAASIDGLRVAQGGGDGAATARAIIDDSNRGGLLSAVNVDVAVGPETITSTARGTVLSILPLGPIGPWTVTATSTGPVERFVAEDQR